MADSEQSKLVSLSISVYRRLLLLYPRAHRREYGPLMLQAFRDLCRDAWRRGGRLGLLRLCLRTLADLLHSVTLEHSAALSQGGTLMIENRPVTPLSWWQVALSVLPGLAFLLTVAPGVTALGRLPGGLPLSILSVPIAILAVAAFLVGLSWLRRRRFPASGLPIVGALLGLGLLRSSLYLLLGVPGAIVGVIYLARQPAIRSRRWTWVLLGGAFILLFLPFAAGHAFAPYAAVSLFALLSFGTTLLIAVLAAWPARRYGLAAGLALLAAGLLVWPQAFDLSYGLAGTPWPAVAMDILGLGLLVVAPVWVLRARSTHSQAWGLLLPTGVALAAAATVSTLACTDPRILEVVSGYRPADLIIGYGSLGRAMLVPHLLRDGLQTAQLMLVLVLAVMLYGRLGDRGEAQRAE